MRSSLLSATALPVLGAQAVTVWLCGDSTMAPGGGGSGTEGWGQYLQYSMNAADFKVVNKAIGGRSARSFTREGRFQDVADQVQQGDWVVIEFGHNDGSAGSTDNGRQDCPGQGDETCQFTYNGETETVLTYPAYYKNAADLFLAKGAKVIMSSPTPNNVCESGTCTWGPYRFDYYPWLAAAEMGGTDAGVYYVPHGAYAAQAMINLGPSVVNDNYPNDHTHTGPYMADVMAGAFALGLKCGTSELGSQGVLNSTESLTTSFYGPCQTFNSTVPI
ncbi:GDSL-like Lipase/Acylhydrolase [Xylariomycetidae sp. FL0641]|nr:GDSL-like Lipase/Acylhydrolase [Xylariomycetidae sp. FL0641]